MESRSPEETQSLGVKLAQRLESGDVLALTGEIGAGKTTFVQGLGRGLGVPEGNVTSPSFVLVREYSGRIPLFHADLFRLDHLAGAETVGLEEYYDAGGATVIEWANRVPGILPKEHLEIRFEVVGPRTRRLHLIPQGKRYQEREWF